MKLGTLVVMAVVAFMCGSALKNAFAREEQSTGVKPGTPIYKVYWSGPKAGEPPGRSGYADVAGLPDVGDYIYISDVDGRRKVVRKIVGIIYNHNDGLVRVVVTDEMTKDERTDTGW